MHGLVDANNSVGHGIVGESLPYTLLCSAESLGLSISEVVCPHPISDASRPSRGVLGGAVRGKIGLRGSFLGLDATDISCQ